LKFVIGRAPCWGSRPPRFCRRAAARRAPSSVALVQRHSQVSKYPLGIVDALPQGPESSASAYPRACDRRAPIAEAGSSLRPGERVRVAIPQESTPFWGRRSWELTGFRLDPSAPLLGPELWRYNHFPPTEFDRLKAHI
jgi:hypothetical protein